MTQPPGKPHRETVSTISVVIPTRNRDASLRRTLTALGRQDRLPDEIVVVDASDQPPDEHALRGVCGEIPALVFVHTRPGVCEQRNTGIRRAGGRYIFLCDDDIEPPPHYLGTLAAYLDAEPSAGAVTGVVCEPDGSGGFSPGFDAPSVRHLLFAFLFQLTVWADVEAARGGRFSRLPLSVLRRWYRRRGNTWTAAGWPLVTQVRTDVMHMSTYGLGAALVRRSWLLASPFDERLGTHGIGDNYGVALGFPGEGGVAVIRNLRVLHHRVAENRLDPVEAGYRRVLALDYFIRTSGRFPRGSAAWLAWSLVGKAIAAGLHGQGDQLRRMVGALAVVVSGRNPLMRDARAPAESPACARGQP